MKRYVYFWLTLIITLCLMVACNSNSKNTNKATDKIQVVTTYSVLYDIVKNVGGNLIEIYSLAPIGSDPHQYDPLPADVQKATDADAIFYNGLNLETGNAWFDNLLETAGKTGEDAPVFRLSEGIEPMYLTSGENEGQTDPHAWLSVVNGIQYVENAKNALIKIDPDHQAEYEENAARYIKELKALHEEIKEKYAQIPKEKRILVSSEGAFKYFAKEYDFEALYIWEINSHNQGTPEQIKRIVDLIKKHDIQALFVETSVDPRSMEMISEETGVPIAGTIFTDSIGKPGENGDSYIKMLRWNANIIYEGIMNN